MEKNEKEPTRNSKKSIIVGIAVLFIVMLILLGLTYAYYRTRVIGNDKNTLSVVSKLLEIKYEDGSATMNMDGLIEPGFEYEKTFTVTNTGDESVTYAVYFEDVINTFVNQDTDPVSFELTCTSNDGNPCNGYDGTVFPSENTKLVSNTIGYDATKEVVHTYTLKVNYPETNKDQSDNMGKQLAGKVQIYDESYVVNIEGTVASANVGDYVEINSKPKKSQIVGGRYKLTAVELGTYTLYVKDKNGNIRGQVTLTINKGTQGVSGTTITINDNSETVTLNITSIAATLGIEITGIKENLINSYTEGTLAYNIINNANINRNGTQFVNSPLTTPAVEKSGVTSYKTIGEEAPSARSMASVSEYSSKTWYYYDTYVVDSATGKFTLSGKHSCTYNSTTTNADGETVNCYDDMVNKYLISHSPTPNTDASDHTAETKTNLSNVYKVTSATATDLNYVKVFNSADEAERVLAPTLDDYGTSYYFRGDVEDNYVNFANMCWRIVRIEGDGSVKLILEDAYAECNKASFTGNWSDGNRYVFGYEIDSKYYKRINFLNYEGGLADSFESFQTSKLTTTDIEKLKVDEWCYDDKVTSTTEYNEYYGAYTRIITNKKPSLTCTGTKLTKFKDGTDMYVATLTADEIVFAGAHDYESANYNNYLINNYAKFGYYNTYELWFSSLSPSSFDDFDCGYDFIFAFSNYGGFGNSTINDRYYSRPAVTLKTETVISSGEGTLEKPYIID